MSCVSELGMPTAPGCEGTVGFTGLPGTLSTRYPHAWECRKQPDRRGGRGMSLPLNSNPGQLGKGLAQRYRGFSASDPAHGSVGVLRGFPCVSYLTFCLYFTWTVGKVGTFKGECPGKGTCQTSHTALFSPVLRRVN